MTGRAAALVLALALAPTVLWGLEGEIGLTVSRTLVAVSAGPPGTPVQEVGTDRAKLEAVAGHKQAFGGWSAEGLGRFGLDTLPSDNPRTLPGAKLEPSARILEAWLGWEPLPGVLTVGAGKRRIQPSSGFSHRPLDALVRDDDREGRTGAQAAWFGEATSFSVFGGPGWPEDGTPGFVLGRAGMTLGAADLKVQLFRSSGAPRAGAGVDGSWGDHLTLRAEVAADADPGAPRADALAGFTWTADDLSTYMAEAVWDGRGTDILCTGFLRAAADLGQDWQAQTWLKAEVPALDWSHPSGWTGLGLTWKAPKWTLDAGWTGAWGPVGTSVGDSPFRWKTEVTAKVFF